MIKGFKRTICKFVITALSTVAILTVNPKNVMADANTDAILAQQALILQQQAIIQAQQAAFLQAYQQALLAQYQKAFMDQYAAALFVQQGLATQQLNAIQQSYMLNAVQAQQAAQYKSMIQTLGLEHQDHLMEEFTKYQNQAIAAFKGYEGIK